MTLQIEHWGERAQWLSIWSVLALVVREMFPSRVFINMDGDARLSGSDRKTSF